MTGNFAKPNYLYRRDPDETDGRRLYRARAEAEARRQLAYEKHRVRLLRDSDTHPKDGDVQQAPLVSGAVPEGQTPNPTEGTHNG